ncbi:hypothetical protein [Actinomadura verrucosospora]|nr:hypothetical protein [Actinomadura verrucosospora]
MERGLEARALSGVGGYGGLDPRPGRVIWLDERDRLAARVRAALEGGCDGSRTALLGSLAAGTADVYSDIDVEWIVPDARFDSSLESLRAVLNEVQPVADVRFDPDFLHSDRRRLVFVRFRGVPLFWRLDLSVRASSVDESYDQDEPRARAQDGEWSRPASALANAIGAVKAVARRRPDDARGLIDRGFARIGSPDRATGAWIDDVARLARAAAAREPRLGDLADETIALANEHLAHP